MFKDIGFFPVGEEIKVKPWMFWIGCIAALATLAELILVVTLQVPN